MERLSGYFEKIADRSTISRAAFRAAAGKRHRADIVAFLNRLDQEACQIVDRMICQTSVSFLTSESNDLFGSYSSFQVRDTKTRTIHAPSFSARVVHHAIIDIIGPALEKGAYRHSYACRKGYGQHAAIRQARKWIEPDLWYLKMDMNKFYDSVDHATLLTMLHRRFRDPRLMQLLEQLIESYEVSPGKGIPIGALTSQYFGNFYLDAVDRWIKQTMRIRRYLRYMDDLLLIGEARSLREVLQRMPEVLDALQLTVKHSGELNRIMHGIPFLGFVLFPHRTSLNKMGKQRLRRRLNRIHSDLQAGIRSEALVMQQAESMLAHAQWDRKAIRRASATVRGREHSALVGEFG